MNDGTRPVPTREGYDRWAAVYDSDDNPLIAVEGPEVARILGDVRGLAVLDVGCGTGRHSIELARAGARVTGVDFSTGMLEKARGKEGAETIRFLQHDVASRLPFEAGSFDRVISCLVVDHVRDLAAFFAELGRVCRPEGFIVVSVMHPAMMLKGVQARFTDPLTDEVVRPESVANQISDYVLGAIAAGLHIREMSEHAVGEDVVARAPRAGKYLGWPILLVMKLTP